MTEKKVKEEAPVELTEDEKNEAIRAAAKQKAANLRDGTAD